MQIEIDYMICIKSIISNFLPCSRLKSIFWFGSSTQRNNNNHNKWYIKKTPYRDKSAWLILPAWLFLREKGETSLSTRGRMAFSLLIRNEKQKNQRNFCYLVKTFRWSYKSAQKYKEDFWKIRATSYLSLIKWSRSSLIVPNNGKAILLSIASTLLGNPIIFCLFNFKFYPQFFINYCTNN